LDLTAADSASNTTLVAPEELLVELELDDELLLELDDVVLELDDVVLELDDEVLLELVEVLELDELEEPEPKGAKAKMLGATSWAK
jgi:hypothetical protein